MKDVVQKYFMNIFTEEKEDREMGIARGMFHALDNKLWEDVNKDFSFNDIKEAMFDMAPFKALGPDGFHAGFYQNQWSTIGATVVRQAKDFFLTEIMPRNMNDTLVLLFLKLIILVW